MTSQFSCARLTLVWKITLHYGPGFGTANPVESGVVQTVITVHRGTADQEGAW